MRSVAVVKALVAALPAALGGNVTLTALLWHQGEEDGGDNRDGFRATYCQYLSSDVSALVDYLRGSFPGASPSTPFVNGGLLPYWEDNVAGGTGGVSSALRALNTSRACTATAETKGVFPDFAPNGSPNGDPKYRSGASGDVIHFTATQATLLGFQYWAAFLRAMALMQVVPSSATAACGGVQPPVTACG